MQIRRAGAPGGTESRFACPDDKIVPLLSVMTFKTRENMCGVRRRDAWWKKRRKCGVSANDIPRHILTDVTT